MSRTAQLIQQPINPNIKTIVIYETSDDQRFQNIEDAEEYQKKRDLFDAFAASHYCKVRQSDLDNHEGIVFAFLEYLREQVPALAEYLKQPEA